MADAASSRGLFGQGGGFGSNTFSAAGSAVSDIFSGFGDQYKAQGDIIEAQNYRLAAQFAMQEAKFTEQSTKIQAFQQQRQTTQSLGGIAAEQASAGFAESGSGLDLLRDSASQGALQKAVLERQGLITEQGYKEQAQSYQNMAAAADLAAAKDKQAATGTFIAAGVQGAAAIASIF